MLQIMNTSDLVTTSIQRKIAVGTQPIKLSTSRWKLCVGWNFVVIGCLTSPSICDAHCCNLIPVTTKTLLHIISTICE